MAQSVISSPEVESARPDLPKLLLRVAWMSIVAGILLQIATIAVKMSGFNTESIAQLSQKVSWSMITCMGLAIGTAASKARTAIMGAAGFLAAPTAFVIARTVQKSVGQGMGLSSGGGEDRFLFLLLAAIKAAEYGLFGVLLAQFGKRWPATLSRYAGVGVLTGAAFAALIVLTVYNLSNSKPETISLIATGINEFLFPPFCAVVIFSAERIGQWQSAQQPANESSSAT